MQILVAEDDVVYSEVLQSVLKGWGHQVNVVYNGEDALRALQSAEPPQLAILDWMMPKLNGVDVCRKIRADQPETYIYLMLLTAKNQPKDLVKGLRAGADDYLTKPFLPAELHARLFAGHRILEFQDNQIASSEMLRHQTTRDPLTGRWNRREILAILKREVNRGLDSETPVSVILADVDQFKEINESHGSAAGDAILREVASRIRWTIRTYDYLGRFGGDEFLLVLPDCDKPSAYQLAELLQRELADQPIIFNGEEIAVTLSQGLVVTDGLNVLETYSLIQAVETALSRAKGNGSGNIEVGLIYPL